ncbi:MAG TPA: hypothetical protein DCL75_11395 [Ktedonobacter sp.]|nr:hypothetical protein [Ktedonobacter sp.]
MVILSGHAVLYLLAQFAYFTLTIPAPMQKMQIPSRAQLFVTCLHHGSQLFTMLEDRTAQWHRHFSAIGPQVRTVICMNQKHRMSLAVLHCFLDGHISFAHDATSPGVDPLIFLNPTSIR